MPFLFSELHPVNTLTPELYLEFRKLHPHAPNSSRWHYGSIFEIAHDNKAIDDELAIEAAVADASGSGHAGVRARTPNAAVAFTWLEWARALVAQHEVEGTLETPEGRDAKFQRDRAKWHCDRLFVDGDPEGTDDALLLARLQHTQITRTPDLPRGFREGTFGLVAE